mgnify:CR=1 FL=1
MGVSKGTRRLQAVLVKAGLEFLVVIAAVSLAAYSHVNPPIRGAIDIADTTRIAGWAYDPREPDARMEIQFFLDGVFAGATVADQPRPDLVKAEAATTPDHGFSIDTRTLRMAAGRHELKAYAVRSGGGRDLKLLSLSKKEHWIEVR